MNDPNSRIRACAESMAAHMEAMSKLFVSGTKITVLVRHPTKPSQNAFLTDEKELAPILEAIEQLYTNPAKVFDV